MAKLKLQKHLELSPLNPTQYRLTFQYDADMLPHLRKYPGVYWDHINKHYFCGTDSEGPLLKLFEDNGYTTSVKRHTPETPSLVTLDERLYDYQLKGVVAVMQQEKVLLNYEMGLGKTPTTIGALQLKYEQGSLHRALIVCPALVRLNWEKEFKKWWPAHPMIVNIHTGKQAELYFKTTYSEPHILITSYGLVSKFTTKVVDDRSNVTYESKIEELSDIVLDEGHYIKNRKSARSQQVKSVCDANVNATKIALTATPITSEPIDLWHQVEVLRPKAFGGFTAFKERYAEPHANEWAYRGQEWKGLNELKADELRQRLSAFTQRVTKEEVAHLLPPFTVQALSLPRVKKLNSRELFETLSSGVRKQHDLNNAVQLAGDHKVGAAVDQALQALENTETVCVLAYFRDTATKIAVALDETLGKLPKKDPRRLLQIVHVDGDVPIKKRMETIDNSKTGKTILIATISSVNVGIDLTHWTTAIFAELYWQPACMIQALGRFSRLSGKLPSTCILLTIEGSLDEPIAYTLQRRLKDQAKLFDKGLAEKGMLDSLGAEEDEDAWLEALNRAVDGRVEEAYL